MKSKIRDGDFDIRSLHGGTSWRIPLRYAGVVLTLVTCWTAFRLPASFAQTTSNSATAETTLTTTRDFKIAGTCFIGKDRIPAPAAKITLISTSGLTGQHTIITSTTSDAEGKFEFEPVEPPSDMRLTKRSYFLITKLVDLPVTVTWVYGYEDPATTRIWMPAEQASLDGRVVDEDGNPVANARVEPYFGPAENFPGTPSAVTNKSGLFLLPQLPRISKGVTLRSQVQFFVTHPKYPRQVFTVKKLPGSVRFTLKKGCTLTGIVQQGTTKSPVANVVVTAEHIETARATHAVTNENGRYRLLVPEGNYQVLLEDTKLVAKAITNLECRSGTQQNLDPIVATTGGWIEGRIINTKTKKSVADTDDGNRLKIGFFGPARPMGRIISPEGIAIVDADGNYRMHVSAGDNFPYFVNIRGQRMGWDTLKQPPVVVAEGKTTTYDMLITPELTAEEKLAAAQQVIDELPKENAARTAAIIEAFRHTKGKTATWAMLVRELKRIGSPAVPLLCEELEKTDSNGMIIRLCFSLRAIGDASAVPSLIRTLPKRLSSTGDYGMLVEDAQLAEFMRTHSLSSRDRGLRFSVNQVIEEHHGTLMRLTNRKVNTRTLYSMRRSDDLRNLVRQQQFYQNAAKEWATWWEANSQKFNVAPQYRKVNLPVWTPPDLSNYPTGLGLTKNAKLGGGLQGLVITPVGDQDTGATFFKDLDTGNEPRWPKHIPSKDASATTETATRNWAAEQGIDLMCVAGKNEEGKITYTLKGIDLKLWEIHPLDAKNIEKHIAAGKLPEGRPHERDEFLHFAEKTNSFANQLGTSFLYVTKNEGLGLITITDFVVTARDITGQFMTEPGVGFHRGVKITFHTIAR